jgi:hypothetical protein
MLCQQQTLMMNNQTSCHFITHYNIDLSSRRQQSSLNNNMSVASFDDRHHSSLFRAVYNGSKKGKGNLVEGTNYASVTKS